nr:MAG TPA: hypothetical protein [Caudoviricetes sp.]
MYSLYETIIAMLRVKSRKTPKLTKYKRIYYCQYKNSV